MNPVADLPDAPERFDIDVQEIAGAGPLVALHRDGRRRRPLNPKRRSQALTVERGIRSARPIAHAGNPCCSRKIRISATAPGDV